MTIINVLYPILSVLLTSTIIPLVIKFGTSKIKAVNLAKDIKIAKLVWNALEEDGRMGDLVVDKFTDFKMAMKAKTKLSDEDILLLNKSIAGIENAGKEAITKTIEPVK